MFKTCISQLFFFFLFSLTKTCGRDRMREWVMRGAVGRAARGAVGEEPSDAPGGLKGAVGGTEPWRKAGDQAEQCEGALAGQSRV